MSTRGHCHLYVPSVHVRQGAHLESVAPLGFGPCLSFGQIPHGVSNLHNHTGPNRPHSHPKRPKPPVSRSARGKPCYDLRFPTQLGQPLHYPAELIQGPLRTCLQRRPTPRGLPSWDKDRTGLQTKSTPPSEPQEAKNSQPATLGRGTLLITQEIAFSVCF